MNRRLLALNLALLAALAALWGLDRSLEARHREHRRETSLLLRLAGEEGPAPASVARLDLTLPGADRTWTYLRRPEGWRMPQHRDAFALGRELEAVLQAFLEGRGTRVGLIPEDERRFGLEDGAAMAVECWNEAGKALLRARAGRIAPGQRSEECFLAAEGRPEVLQLQANPWSPIEWTVMSRTPPLMDPKVIPSALSRGAIARVVLEAKPSPAGTAPALTELIRKEIPRDPQAPGPDRGPRFEWYGVRAGEGEKRLDDSAAYRYVQGIVEMAFDELLGTAGEPGAAFAGSELSLTLHHDGGAKDVLELGAPRPDGLVPLHHSATRQVMLITAEKARALAPDAAALLRTQ